MLKRLNFSSCRLRWPLLLLGPLLWLVAGCAQQAAAPAQALGAPQLLTLDADALALARERVRRGDADLQAPLKALMARAQRALQTPLRSVTHKTAVPPSGSKHDYMSSGPYWWPNPDSPNGLPYVRRDGQRNPAALDQAFDSKRMQDMLIDLRDLALAYHFTGEARYAIKAGDMLRTWFIDPVTRMNPHLKYGQSIPGIAEGRGIGIIDTRDLWIVADAVALIAPVSSAMPLPDRERLRAWLADYAQWLHTSPLGRDEAAEKNNHGMFFDSQLASVWLAVGETQNARQLVFEAQQKRFAKQIDTQGRLPLELSRTRPFHYHTFTLQAGIQLARYAQQLQLTAAPGARAAADPGCAKPGTDPLCPLNLWAANIEGKSLRGVLDFVARFVTEPAAWTYATAVEPAPPLATALPVLLQAQRALPSAKYGPALARLRELAPDDVSWLLWPAP